MKQYDFIFAGGGLAGLSLAYHLSQSDLRDRSILVVDQLPKDRNDRTWCFWTGQPTLFDNIVFRSWHELKIKTEAADKTIALRDYSYNMIRGIDFYRHVRRELSARGNIEFVQGHVDRIKDAGDHVEVWVGSRIYAGQWAFDSRFHVAQLRPDATHYSLRQHFHGWTIETPYDAFDLQAATLFDFRTEQKNELRFFYTLPLSTRQALVEYVLLSSENYERELKTYVETTLGIHDYKIIAHEGGIDPLTDYDFPRRIGSRTLTIGTLGGRVKPTTGYAFTRIQSDSAAIVNSLLQHGHPFNLPPDSPYYRLCDSLLLQLMSRRGAHMKDLFVQLFENNPIERVFRFLDETASPAENLALMASLPSGPFLQALASKVLRIPPSSPEFLRVPGIRGNSAR